MSLRRLTNWTESNGGPLLLTPTDQAAVWQGGLYEDDLSHYRAACNASGWTGAVSVDRHRFAVLFGEPLPTLVADIDGTTICIRWLYADSDDELIQAVADWVRGFNPESTPTCKVEFWWPAGTFALFDAARSGSDRHGGVTFAVGHRVESVRTDVVEADEQTAFVVDWLL